MHEQFDVIAALDVLEHIDDDVEALRQMGRALRPSGGLIITVPQHPSIWSEADEWALHFRRYTRTGMRLKLTQAGFEIVRATSFVSLLLPAMLLSRLRLRRRPYDPLAELTLPQWLDAVLSTLLSLELTGIKRGLSLPAGGSLMVVARKAPRSS